MQIYSGLICELFDKHFCDKYFLRQKNICMWGGVKFKRGIKARLYLRNLNRVQKSIDGRRLSFKIDSYVI